MCTIGSLSSGVERRRRLGQLSTFRRVFLARREEKQRRVYFLRKITTCPDNVGLSRGTLNTMSRVLTTVKKIGIHPAS